MVTISLIATAYILPQDAGSASSLFNILRNLGGAIGIALLATLLDARTKTYFDYLRESMVPSNPQVAERLASLTNTLGNERRRWASSARLPISRRRSWPTTMRFTVGIALGVSMLAVLLTRKLPAGLPAKRIDTDHAFHQHVARPPLPHAIRL
jgi:DHA2 family multidrug resistance protein